MVGRVKYYYANTYRELHDRDNFSNAILWPISGVMMAGPRFAYAATADADGYYGYYC